MYLYPLNSREHLEFTKTVLKERPSKVIRAIERKLSDGELTHGIFVRNGNEMVQKVGSNIGGIGYVSTDFIILDGDNVKIIEVR